MHQWVMEMAERATETMEVPRRVTIPMVALIAAASSLATYVTNRALDHQQIQESASDINDLKPRMRSVEDDNLKEDLVVASLQTQVGETKGSLEVSRKELGERMQAVEKALAILADQISRISGASTAPLPGDRKK